jgi:UDP-N-acetyl-D-glucosamine dehydrogenase
MVKLLENTFRMINIGLVNEIALMCDRMGINVWEVIDAAATKPFGFMPFYPGPGLGGHCIPIDPFYLSWKTKQAGIEARFIELAGYINGQMPHFVVDKIQNALNEHSKPLKGSRVHVLGVAYKRDIDDVRESPALDVIHLLCRRGARVTYNDPYVPAIQADGIEMKSVDSGGCSKRRIAWSSSPTIVASTIKQ